MKRGALFLLILILGCTAYGQSKRKRSTTKKTATANKSAGAVGSANSVVKNVAEKPLADTNKKVVILDRPIDGYYKKTNTINAQPIAYATVRQADVIFAKRIWREIDVREKMNQYMASPKARLIDALVDAIKNDELRAFDPTQTKDDVGGDEFSTPLTSAQAMRRLSDSVMIDNYDKTTGDKIGSTKVAGEFNPDSVVRFRIKEDWIFDKQRSVFEPRIIGIAPLMRIVLGGGKSISDYQPVFWIYFPEARSVLATKSTSMRDNDATNLSYDQIFLKRMFSSYIVKESNDKDERIKDYAQGKDRLYESERIKKSLLDWELNLWQY
jgi:gliding motility associated protien GldN